MIALVVYGVGVHAVWRSPIPQFAANQHANWRSIDLWCALGAGMFIAQILFVDSMFERNWGPSYPRHFDTAWKQGVQLALAAVFVALFWGVIELGAQLFDLVGIDFFSL